MMYTQDKKIDAAIWLDNSIMTESAQNVPLPSVNPKDARNRGTVNISEGGINQGVVEGPLSSLRALTRFACTSPWFSIILYLLSGKIVGCGFEHVYPFKALMLYERHLRKYVELLNETVLDPLKPKDAISAIARITREVLQQTD